MVAARPNVPVRRDSAIEKPPQFVVVTEPFWIINSGVRDLIAEGVKDRPAQAEIASEAHYAPIVNDSQLLANIVGSGLPGTKDSCSQAAISDYGDFN
jgi:hypothetical protein